MLRLRTLLSSPSAILATALVLRLVYLLHFFQVQPSHSYGNFPMYESVCVAKSIAEGQGFSSPLPAPSGPTAMVPPIFAYLLAAVFKVSGALTFPAAVAIRSLDGLFSALTCLPIVLIGRRLFGPTTASLAGWIWAVSPSAVFYSIFWIWDTTLSAMFLAISLWLTYRIGATPDGKAWSKLGIVWGLGTLTNSALLTVVPGCLAFSAYRARQQGGSWLRSIGISGLAFVATLSPWIARNELTFHGQVFLRSNFGLELWLGNNPEVPISCACWLHPSHHLGERAKFISMGEVSYMREKRQLALDFIKTHPADTARSIYHRFMETWTGFPDPFLDIWAGHNTYLRVMLVLSYGFTTLSLLGLLLAYRRDRLQTFPLLNLIVVFPLVYYVCHTDQRYRQPIEPVMALLTAYALARIARLFQNRVPGGRASEAESVPGV